MNVQSIVTSDQEAGCGPEDCFVIETRRIVRFLALLSIMIVIVGTFANITIYQIAEHDEAVLAKIMRRFDLGHEPSIPAWFSSLLLFANALTLILIGTAKKRTGAVFSFHWIALGLIFVGLSIDEAVMFHEMIDGFLLQVIPQSSILIFPWVVVGGAIALVVFLTFLKFLLHLEYRFQKLFVLSGLLFVGGAVGIEFIAGWIIDMHGVESIQHTFVQTVEESMEIAGSLLFLYSLLEYWNAVFANYPIKLASGN